MQIDSFASLSEETQSTMWMFLQKGTYPAKSLSSIIWCLSAPGRELTFLRRSQASLSPSLIIGFIGGGSEEVNQKVTKIERNILKSAIVTQSRLGFLVDYCGVSLIIFVLISKASGSGSSAQQSFNPWMFLHLCFMFLGWAIRRSEFSDRPFFSLSIWIFSFESESLKSSLNRD